MLEGSRIQLDLFAHSSQWWPGFLHEYMVDIVSWGGHVHKT
jgi:hypothetical protein